MTRVTALLDANILYPAPLRDIYLQLAVEDVFRAQWTSDIHREWIDALLRNEPHRSRAALERTRGLMDQATRDCLVTGYETLIPALSLPATPTTVMSLPRRSRLAAMRSSPPTCRTFRTPRSRRTGLRSSTRTTFFPITSTRYPGRSAKPSGRCECASWRRRSAFKTISPPSPDRDSLPPPPNWPSSWRCCDRFVPGQAQAARQP